MTETKYGKYFLKEPLAKSRHPESNAPVVQIGDEIAAEGWGGTPIHFVMHEVHEPMTMGGENGHTHPYDEIVFFIGADPMNYRDFGAEAEFMMGEEMEKHIVNTTTFVYIPKNLLHCPLVFTRVDKPVQFGHILFSPTYEVERRGE